MSAGQPPRSTDLVTKSIHIPSPSLDGEITDVLSAVPIGPNDPTLSGGRIAMVTSTPLPAFTVYPVLPGYQIVCELGRGGMGVVYRAKQERLKRTVAVKMLLHHDAADAGDVLRFRSEAEAVASIAHPHVVKVYESGQHEGRSYFTMEYLPGGSLHAKLRAKAPFSPTDSALLVEKLARAVHAAHSLGIVHRDLKPGNVLYDVDGEPRVTDFGLAKRTACELTRTQAVMGTPAYMPPEQAAGKAKYVGPPADIYALGVILYECLSGALPFAASDSLALLNQVIAQEPPPIHQRVPTVPRDLELICLKCLEKGPADRYQTAEALADDLRRFVNREPVSVRPAGRIERTLKWMRRRPTLAAAYGLGMLVTALTVLGGGAAILAYQAVTARDDASRHWQASEEAREQLEQQADELEKARVVAEDHRKAAEKAWVELACKHEQVEAALAGEQKAKQEVEASREQLEIERYFANVALAHKEAGTGNYLRAINLLDACPEDRRRWEWWHAYRTTHMEAGSGVTGIAWPIDIAFTGRGINLTTSHAHQFVIRFDFTTGLGDRVKVCPADSSVKISGDGSRAVAVRAWGEAHADGVTVWDIAAGKQVAAFKTPKAACRTFELSPDGKRVVFQYSGQPVRAYEVDSGKELGKLDCQLSLFKRVRLSADGRTAVAGLDGGGTGDSSEVVVWDVDTGKELRRVKCESGLVSAVGLSRDGKTVGVASTTGEVRFHPIEGKAVVLKRGHVGAVTAIVFSPDGTRAATAGDDGAVRVWDPTTGGADGHFSGHTKRITALAFHPDGSMVASCDAAGGFRVWDYRNPLNSVGRVAVGSYMTTAFAADRDLNRVFAGGKDDLGWEWVRQKNTEHALRAPPGTTFTAAAIHPTAKQKAVGTARGEVYLQSDTDATPEAIESTPGRVHMLRYSADGGRLLGSVGNEYRIWDTATGKVLAAEAVGEVGTAVAISGDGKRVAVRYGKQAVLVADVGDKNRRLVTYLSEDVTTVGFTPDGNSLVVGTREWGLSVHQLDTLKDGAMLSEGAKYVGHTAPVTSMAYSADGTRLASGAADGTVRVWDVATRHEAISVSVGTKETISAVWFTGDGMQLIAQPETGPPVVFDGSPRELAFRPDKPRPNGPLPMRAR